MAKEINQRELRNDSGAILQAAANGETFIVTRNGTPMAELRPLSKRTFVSKEEALRATAHLPPVDGRGLHAELDELFDPEPYRD
ncbi:type II toxin-antitoxin system Phd/YefM family antitoxin [Allosalinactinospora lopnorensis]|uniref:type II toxin-antitoxin system Phd/YefM family antitoxin n=1 Tax=Allosalinactinospora lopnorensis TaxID=1352348 RepID=UPI000623F206|nr:type II toxin-antitoxin system prevent-host-death family antitoxin [Allosalinactinospora lopnorensis]